MTKQTDRFRITVTIHEVKNGKQGKLLEERSGDIQVLTNVGMRKITAMCIESMTRTFHAMWNLQVETASRIEKLAKQEVARVSQAEVVPSPVGPAVSEIKDTPTVHREPAPEVADLDAWAISTGVPAAALTKTAASKKKTTGKAK